MKQNTEMEEDACTPNYSPHFDLRDTMAGSLDKSKRGGDASQHKKDREGRVP